MRFEGLKQKYVIFSLATMIVLLLSTFTYAVDDLEITGIRAYVDNDRQKSVDKDGGDLRNVHPGSVIEIEVTLKNTFSKSSRVDIDDISIRGIIRDIDLGSDLDEEKDDIELNSGEDDSITLEWTIPELVESGNYKLELSIRGRANDDDRTKFNEEIDFYMELQKEAHKLELKDVKLGSNELYCGGVTYLDVNVLNLGHDDTEAFLSVKNPALKINYLKKFTLSADINSDSNSQNKNFVIRIPEDAIGEHVLNVKLDYKNERESIVKGLTITCDKPIITEPVIEEPVEVIEEVIETPVENETQELTVGAGGLTGMVVGTNTNTTENNNATIEYTIDEFFTENKIPIIIVSLVLFTLLFGIMIILMTSNKNQYQRPPFYN